MFEFQEEELFLTIESARAVSFVTDLLSWDIFPSVLTIKLAFSVMRGAGDDNEDSSVVFLISVGSRILLLSKCLP